MKSSSYIEFYIYYAYYDLIPHPIATSTWNQDVQESEEEGQESSK